MLYKTNKWGDVDGDTNADAIISDRKPLGKFAGWLNVGSWVLTILFAILYGFAGGSGLLAALVVFAAMAAANQIVANLVPLLTMVQIAERRAQLIEADLLHLEERVEVVRDDTRSLIERARPTSSLEE